MRGIGLLGVMLVGLIAGWIAKRVLSRDLSLFASLGVGVAGALLGFWITRALDLDLPQSYETSVDPEAFQCYLRGRRYMLEFERGHLEDGRKQLEEAIRVAPDYAPALAALAGACAFAYNFTCDIFRSDLLLTFY